MFKKLKILFLSVFWVIFSDSLVFTDYKSTQKDQEDFFITKIIHNYPLLTTFASVGLLTCGLYPKEVLAAIDENKDSIFALGVSVILLGYVTHVCSKYFLNKNNDENEYEQDRADSISKLDSMIESSVRVYQPGDIKETFKDVAGLGTAKEDLSDIRDFLENPKTFKTIGAKVPKGILMSGAPGNGKTLLARALAGEVGCPFLYISGTEFSEMFVGVGAARVRDLFEIARKYAPCIVFIDEIDTIGHKRSAWGNGGNSDAQTLNQLLAEMDGFEKNKSPIIVIGATNRIDVIDEALLRPGRFDRKIEILPPFFNDRIELLSMYLKKIKASVDIDIAKIALGTIGFSGAELANLINEAALLALRNKSKVVTMKHIDEARDYILLGRETKGMDITSQEAWNTAIHEAGHSLMRVYKPDAAALLKVSITPRGGALGITFGMLTKEKYSRTDIELKAEISVLLGGSVAEEIILGQRGAGASNDLEKVRYLVTKMVMEYGMTDDFKDVSFKEYIYAQVHLPDQIATELHQAVAKIIAECRKETETILMKHKDLLLDLAKKLVSDGTVIGSDVYKMCGIQEPELVYSLI
ncbi:ATP-dependent zinc metalloprotease FtsH [Candidatus Dependentiae bacterium]|nr:ATP-dependent zinc metalloprotease FtsH [Candidatus Dependentiae bacterium]